VYATDGTDCDCAAALLGGDPVCKHRALFWFDCGVLRDESDTPVIDSDVCPVCRGDGYTRVYVGGHLSDWESYACHACGATGRVLDPVAIRKERAQAA
jgi:hypothetical protein